MAQCAIHHFRHHHAHPRTAYIEHRDQAIVAFGCVHPSVSRWTAGLCAGFLIGLGFVTGLRVETILPCGLLAGLCTTGPAGRFATVAVACAGGVAGAPDSSAALAISRTVCRW